MYNVYVGFSVLLVIRVIQKEALNILIFAHKNNFIAVLFNGTIVIYHRETIKYAHIQVSQNVRNQCVNCTLSFSNASLNACR